MMQDSIAYNKSIAMLHTASQQAGFVAAVQNHDNYRRIWTRDGTVCSLAAILSNDEQLIMTARATIETVFLHQHPVGYMPSNVTPQTKQVSYGGIVGRADNPSWAVIGLCHYTLATGDRSLADRFAREVEKCFSLLTAWEFNGRHLVYVPQSGDWADEYIQHGYILFEQLLRIWALRLAAKVYGKEEWAQKAALIKTTVQNNYWQQPDTQKLYAPNMAERLNTAFNGYWLMGFNPSRIYEYFDLQANSLACLLKVGDESRQAACVQWMDDLRKQKNNLLPSFHPTIEHTDPDMKELRNNHTYSFRNLPYQFHNGGLWPVWNGLLAMAFADSGKQDAAWAITAAIHKANGDDFNECLHGQHFQPCGVSQCAWSAAGAIIAEQALLGKRLIMITDGE